LAEDVIEMFIEGIHRGCGRDVHRRYSQKMW